MAGCSTCGTWLIETARQTMSSPAEYECPHCDRGISLEELDRPEPEPEDYTYSGGVLD